MSFRSLVRSSVLGVVLLSSVQGCTTPSKELQVTSQDREPVEIRVGMGTFAHFCYKKAPSFTGFEEEALSGNFNRIQNGWLEHSDFEASMVVRDHGDLRNCQFTFVSNQPVSVFEEHLEYPFNATEVPKAVSRDLYRSDFHSRKYKGLIDRTFIGKTTFDGDVPAMFFGYVFENPEAQVGENTFGLILQVAKEDGSQS